MKKLLAALVATTVLAAPAFAGDITEFRIGLLGGENAQDRLTWPGSALRRMPRRT